MSDKPPADPDDEAGWDHDVHGSMAEHATADGAVTTVPADEYLAAAPLAGNVEVR